ncbi:hypothetical protein D3C83_185740 [compost metagenome]
MFDGSPKVRKRLMSRFAQPGPRTEFTAAVPKRTSVTGLNASTSKNAPPFSKP